MRRFIRELTVATVGGNSCGRKAASELTLLYARGTLIAKNKVAHLHMGKSSGLSAHAWAINSPKMAQKPNPLIPGSAKNVRFGP
jgi:hypothetical protein